MFTTPKYEGVRQSDWLLYEEGETGRYSRENITLIAGLGILPTGTVLGKITASGKFTTYDNAAVDGSQTAAGILAEPSESTVEHAAAAVVRHARIAPSFLGWKAGTSEANKAAALVELAAIGIATVREV